MEEPLATYLADHLAGSVHAIEQLKAIRDAHAGEPLGQFAARLLVEIESDRETLKQIADRVGADSPKVKELAAWFAEKVSRAKLKHGENGLGTFEALEFLELGIHGKWALWRALAVIAPNEPRLQGPDYQELINRAEMQRGKVEEQRLETARTALQRKPH